VLYSDYIGPARLRLNLPELAPELKRVYTPGLEHIFDSWNEYIIIDF